MQALSIPSTVNIAAPESDLAPPQRRTAGRPAKDNATATAKVIPQTQAAEPLKNATTSATVTSSPTQATAVHEERAKSVTQGNANPSPAQSTTNAVPVQDKSKRLDQMGLFASDVELINRINVLQQQLGSSQEREKHLRRQLNDSELRLQKEQQKSRTLQS